MKNVMNYTRGPNPRWFRTDFPISMLACFPGIFIGFISEVDRYRFQNCY